MSRAILFLLGSFILLLNCSGVHGQGCSTTLEPHFNVYNSISRDGNIIYTSVTTQGYSYVCGPCGCPQMSSATHYVGAENKLNNVDHWSYSAPDCPTCYFSVTDNEQIDGTPGVQYPWCWDGDALCSITGDFWDSGSCSTIEGCVVPSTETTQAVAPYNTTSTSFSQRVSDSAADSFDGLVVQEGDANPAQDTCWFSGSNIARWTGVTGGIWTVAGNDVPGQHNTWGFDNVGWTPNAVSYYRTQDPAHGIGIPCGFTLYQSLQIECPASASLAFYTPSYGNKLTGTIDVSNVVNCRYDISNTACQTINH